MKNIIRVTAIILTMVTVIVTHPFLSLEAKAFDRPIKMDRIKNSGGSGTGIYAGLVQASYSYSTSDANFTYGADLPLTYQFTTPLTYFLDIELNLREHVDYCSMSCSLTYPATNDYYLNYVGVNCQITASNTSYNSFSLNIYNTDHANIRFIFTLEQLKDNYNYTSTGPTPTDMSVEWVENGYTYVDIVTFNVTSVTFTPDDPNYTPYLDGIEGYIDGIETTLGNIYTNVDSIRTLVANIDSSLTSMDALLYQINQHFNDIQTMQLYQIPEYSWSIYYLFKRKWLLKYDDTFPRPYVTTTNDSSTTFDWNDAIQIQDKDLYIVLATFGASSSTLPVKIIKSNNTDVSADFTWTYRYTGRYRFYYTKIPESLFNNALNIKWTAAVNVMPVYLGRLRNMPFEVAEICNLDSNNQIVRILNDLKTAINNINVTNNTTVNEINTNITEYNTTIQNVFNIENNLSTSLDQSMQQFTPDNTNILQRLNDSSTLLKSVVNQINGIDIFTIPLAVALVGIVLIAIVG